MIAKRLEARIAEYAPGNSIEQELVLCELLQQFVLASLARAGFFSRALFHGGTCLRLCYGTERFSEDLDFLLLEPDPEFCWKPIIRQVQEDCRDRGIEFEIQDRSSTEGAVKKSFFKTDSIGKLILLQLPHSRDSRRMVRIKLEIDTNPPVGSTSEVRYLDFPVTVAIVTQTLASSLSLKSHALLCRSYAKGRDWWDFVWFVRRRIQPDYKLLSNALDQQGPWAGRTPAVDRQWYLDTLRQRIESMDWSVARDDVARFVPARDQESLASWNMSFFRFQLDRMAEYLV